MNVRTKIDHWCESVIEAGWLAALITAPMFFNVFSSRVFEPDKISLIRSIALLMLVAWLVKLANGGAVWLPAFDAADNLPNEDDSHETVSIFSRIWQIPFIVPILLLVVAYLISTTTSVARFVSWWGSYQRLQGTYTFLSYTIIALLTAAHLRHTIQLQRLQHVIIVTSLPIAIYGVIQHYGIDPLPWGGDVTTRIAANAGNAIFLAAYLIMAVFLTIERVYHSFAYLLSSDASNNSNDDDGKNSDHERQDIPTALAGGAYLFVLMVQLLAIFWTQSRGPWLGLFLGLYLFVLLLFSALRPKNHRTLTLGWVGVGLAGIVLIVLMNTSPFFAPMKTIPYVGRLTELLDLESRTAKVRTLIWQGAADMSRPHEALIFPDRSTDSVNALRPLVGYGPEAMWIAYNPFYPPELAHWEARNASPDRAHNETWDSIVVTGFLGFLAYMSLFISIFYWALRWLGLIVTKFDSVLFGILLAIGGIGLSVVFYIMDGQQWRLLGVSLPAGMMAGLVLFAMVAAFIHSGDAPDQADTPRKLLIIALLTTIIAHFVEIHFGIAIAATRTYFWIETALLLCVGMRWLKPPTFAIVQEEQMSVAADGSQDNGEAEDVTKGTSRTKTTSKRRAARQRNQRRRPVRTARQSSSLLGLVPSMVMTDVLIFMTFVFIYSTNSRGLDTAFGVLWSSITSRTQGGESIGSPALLFLMLFTWVVAALLGLTSESLRQKDAPPLSWWIKGLGIHALIVWGAWLVYGLIQGRRLIPGIAGTDLTAQLDHVAGHFALYTWLVVTWIIVGGTVYAWSVLRQNLPTASRGLVTALAGAILATILFVIISTVNISLVRADIIYKQGQQFDSQRNWVSSIELYRRAMRARTTEDHYMLFLGRSLLEQAKQAPEEGMPILGANPTFNDVLSLAPNQVNAMGKVELLRAAEVVLRRAQQVNPLNTDHTANLARLYRTWADQITDPEERQEQLDLSLSQYEMAVTLSPNAAHLWNEKGNAHLARGEEEKALSTYHYSLSIDPLFEQTYLLIADYHNRREEFQEVVDVLVPGIALLEESRRHRPTVQLLSFLGVAQSRLGDTEGAIETNEKIIDMDASNLGALRNLTILNREIEDSAKAIEWAEAGLAVLGPEPREEALQFRQLLTELYQAQGQTENVIEQYESMLQIAPTNATILRQLYGLYRDENNVPKLAETLQALMAAEPTNYQFPLELAQIMLDNGDAEQALQLAEQALSLAPDDQKESVTALITQINSDS